MGETEWEAATPQAFADLLEMADRALAERQIPVSERPLAALIQLVHWQVIAGADGTPIELDGSAIAQHQAFRPLGKMIGEWYERQYGASRLSRASEQIIGVVLVRVSPFLINVPTSVVEPGDAPDIAWFRFTDCVLPTEDVLDWLDGMPRVRSLPEVESVRESIAAVASDLRFIYTASLGVPCGNNEQLQAFLRGVRSHLNQAATRLANQRTQDVAESYWEMQMAAEVTLKALLLQRTGRFPYTHSLSGLLKSAKILDPSFGDGVLKDFPDDHETIRRRYGTGTVSWDETFGHYRVILNLVSNSMGRMEQMRLNRASFCIRKAPWATGWHVCT